jgi:hypothetical protein
MAKTTKIWPGPLKISYSIAQLATEILNIIYHVQNQSLDPKNFDQTTKIIILGSLWPAGNCIKNVEFSP